MSQHIDTDTVVVIIIIIIGHHHHLSNHHHHQSRHYHHLSHHHHLNHHHHLRHQHPLQLVTNLDFLPEEFLTVVEAAEVQVLAEQLDGWLGAVGVQLGHVEVVDHDDHALVHWRTCKHSLPLSCLFSSSSLLFHGVQVCISLK